MMILRAPTSVKVMRIDCLLSHLIKFYHVLIASFSANDQWFPFKFTQYFRVLIKKVCQEMLKIKF